MIGGLIIVVAVLGAPPAGALPLANVVVKDGDTVSADVLLPLDIIVHKESIRAGDFDACEVSKTRSAVEVTPEEIARGKAAKAALKKLVADADQVWFIPYKKRDKYGRRLGRIFVDDLSLKDWAEENNFVRPKP